MNDHLTVAIDAAQAAGELLKSGFGRIETIEYKSDQSLVTNLDNASEALIVDRLLGAFPGYGIIGEETGRRAGAAEYTWVIDPLDGTHNYVRSITHYGVCIGLLQNDEFVAGVIYMPSEGDLFAAEAGGGSFKNGAKISVSAVDSLEASTVSFDSGFRRDPSRMTRRLETVAAHVFNIRISGCSARNLSWLAEGKIDGVIEFDDRIWDYAAGAVLVKEAGGMVTDHQGAKCVSDHAAFLGTNGRLHTALLDMLQ